MTYPAAFVLCVCLSAVSTWYVRKLANARGWIHEPKLDRHLHTIPVPRLGGVAIYFSFMSVVILATALPYFFGTAAPLHAKAMVGLLGPALIVFLLGLYDDVYSLSAYWKFGIEAIAAIWLYAGGYGIHNLGLIHGGQALDWIYDLPLTILWVLLITNAFNLIDGLDGLAAGSALFSTVVVFVMSLIVPNPLVAFLAIALTGAILGFLRFNFYPASIFLGDSGSLFIGFMLAALALAGSEKAPTMVAVAIPIVSLGLPILDVVLAVMRRFLGGKPLFEGDRDHIHHKLLKRGLSQRGAVLVLYGVTTVFALLSLVLLHGAAMIGLVLAAIGIGITVGVQYLGYAEFSELQGALRRTAERKRAIANNVEVRHAVEALDACKDFRLLCGILENTLEAIGFDGFRLRCDLPEAISDAPLAMLERTADGTMQLHWDDSGNNEAIWELRLDLYSEPHHRLGHISLLRTRYDNPLLVDFNLLSREFRTALANAMFRLMNGHASAALVPRPGRRAPAVKATSAASSD
jgi:UDP-GlcNAc:undecaprenyl-phosphate/decaprenyl-phosphate GlcNAc-1-phosphate transferase